MKAMRLPHHRQDWLTSYVAQRRKLCGNSCVSVSRLIGRLQLLGLCINAAWLTQHAVGRTLLRLSDFVVVTLLQPGH